MACLDARGHAGRTKTRVVLRQRRQRGVGRRVRRIAQERPHGCGYVRGLDGCGAFEERPRDVAQHHREPVAVQPGQCRGQLGDGVVTPRQGAVSAAVGDQQLVVLVGLLARLQVVGQPAALLEDATPALVQRERRVNQPSMVAEQPVHAVVGACFLVGRQHQHDVAVGRVALAPQPDERRGPDGRFVLVVHGAAAVEPAIALGEGERRDGPVLGQRLHDVQVGHDENRLAHDVPAAKARDQIAPVRRRTEHLDVGLGKPRGPQPRRHGLGRARRASRLGGVDLDQLFENRLRQTLVLQRAPVSTGRRLRLEHKKGKRGEHRRQDSIGHGLPTQQAASHRPSPLTTHGYRLTTND